MSAKDMSGADTDWSLRRANASDADALAACIDAAYAPYAERIDDLPPVSADIANEIDRYQVWVADIAGDIAGGLVLIPEDGFMMLANVAVHPRRMGMGLGRALIAHAEAEAKVQGFGELRLSTHAKMPENLRLYQHLGWDKTGAHANKITMRKVI